MQELRAKCPWDQKQTPESLTRYAIEEAYEVEEAVRSQNTAHVKEELGDLLLQVVFQSQMYSEQGAFNFHDVVETLCDKLIRRHPHVFQSAQFEQLNEQQVSELWQKIKAEENKDKTKSRLDEIKAGPALAQAEQIQKNVAQIGFDFENVEQAYEKLDEELSELREALNHQNSDEIQEEFGDCLFSLINIGRKIGISSEMALLGTIHKFKQRFSYIELQAKNRNTPIENMSLKEMDQLWDQAKVYLKQHNNKIQVQHE